MTPSQQYYYSNLEKFQEYQHIRNHINVVNCESCNKSYRKDYLPKHIETNYHKKNKSQ
jgi:hypothetical protein